MWIPARVSLKILPVLKFGLLPLLRKSEHNSCIVTTIRVRSNDQITIESDKNIKINTESFLAVIWLHNDEINFWIPFSLKLIAIWHILCSIPQQISPSFEKRFHLFQ